LATEKWLGEVWKSKLNGVVQGDPVDILLWMADLSDFEQTKTTCYNITSIAWNVIGWRGISSFITGLLSGTMTRWRLFKHYWIAVKFMYAQPGMSDPPISQQSPAHSDWVGAGSLRFYLFLIAISILKPRFSSARKILKADRITAGC
jgi:hypothetical protein